MKKLALLLILTACATTTAYDRQDRLARARDEFAIREQQCIQAGGYMVIKRYGGSRRTPNAVELETAECAVRY